MHALAPVLVTAPSETAVSRAELKRHLVIEHDEDDLLLDAALAGALAMVDVPDGRLGRALVTQRWQFRWDAFPDAETEWRLRWMPVVTDPAPVLTYLDANGASQPLATTVWRIDTDDEGPVITLKDGQDWPETAEAPDAVRLEISLGYGAAASVPAGIRAAILMAAADLYRFRDSGAATAAASDVVDRWLMPYRRPWGWAC